MSTAREFAICAHGDQKYDGDKDYVFHLDEVAEAARRYLPVDWLVTATGLQADDVARLVDDLAYLHDVVEDTKTGEAEVEAAFDVVRARCVAFLSDAPGLSRKERKRLANLKFASTSGIFFVALFVKIGDRFCNVRMSTRSGNRKKLQMYLDEHGAFRAAAYRRGMCDALWSELDGLLADALISIHAGTA